MIELHGKRVIITGASAGIGAATARAFVAAGARVALAARDAARLDALAAELAGETLVVPTDMADQQAVAALAERVVAAWGGIDIVVHNAGVGLAAPVAELRAADWDAALAVNVTGPVLLTQAALPHMGRGAQFVFVSSVVGLRALPYLGGYAATKAALDRLTESLRVELRDQHIAVTLVRPGSTATEFSAKRLGSGHEQRRVKSRGVPPERVAETIVRAARRQPRVAYVRFGDRLNVLFSALAPGLTDRVLGRAFGWESQPSGEKNK